MNKVIGGERGERVEKVVRWVTGAREERRVRD